MSFEGEFFLSCQGRGYRVQERKQRKHVDCLVKVTVRFERCFRLTEHISVISCRNPINLYITEKLIKFSESLFNFF